MVLAAPLAPDAVAQQVSLTDQASGVTAVLQAISPVNDSVVWVGGHGGVILRTVDGGRTWRRIVAPADDSLQFRDVYAVSTDTAFVLSAGPGSRSRIYRTTDGGARWVLQFLNRDSSAFYDCFDFWDARHGLALSDAVAGHLLTISTTDGATWAPASSAELPVAQPGEAGFAASGTCVLVRSPGLAWIGTGAEGQGRVYRSADSGRTWSVTVVPVTHGSRSSGVTTLAFRDGLHGVALGGDIGAPDSSGDYVALTADGGRSWIPGGRLPFAGPAYGSASVPGDRTRTLFAAGPKGLAISRDDGRSWALVSPENYWAVAFAGAQLGWAVGARGRVTRIELR
jgi:photosystem II stability/assembly factor-like uncharacterized protein